MPTRTPMQIRQEIRFAVVMYGGVSLAIYINGVAQELLRMVRATAPDPTNPAVALLDFDALDPRERVYRALGQMLGADTTRLPEPHAPITTRFVVDILSGTSAGGINAVYLAKALANDQPFDLLEHLWLTEGDLERLLNDRQSTADLSPFPSVECPRALLNGQRMYRKLLDALADMEQAQPSQSAPSSPFVNELDLFVTATDIHGTEVRLPLADGTVGERRHRNVFHFRYRNTAEDALNDFVADNDAFLAFAARCTSSFPFAFEPMRLGDIGPVLATSPRYASRAKAYADPERWVRFFPAYDAGTEERARYVAGRAFGDGGYLDNKPFTFAIEALSQRGTSVPTRRKLLYVEPNPEILPPRDLAPPLPNAIENVAAGLGLARYETIREDLERLIARNRLIERVDRILSEMESDVWGSKPPGMPASQYVAQRAQSFQDFMQSDDARQRTIYGVPYGGYRRLVVAAVSDDIATWVSAAAGFAPHTAPYFSVRRLVHAWRDREFPEHATQAQRAQFHSREAFLFRYNVGYRIRRLRFLLDRIDRLHAFDTEAARILRLQHELDIDALAPGWREAFQDALRAIRADLEAGLATLRRLQANLEAPAASHPLAEAMAAAGRSIADMRALLVAAEPTDGLGSAVVPNLPDDAARALGQALASLIASPMRRSHRVCANAFKANPKDDAAAALARATVRGYHDLFQDYDLIAFPILHASGVGEELAPVEVFRVSPRDAHALIDERSDRRRKLAGTAFSNFGAFLDSGWRRNDILWGSLDGVERLVCTLLPNHAHAAVRRALVDEAHKVRLECAFRRHDQTHLTQSLADAILKAPPGSESEQRLRAQATSGNAEQPHVAAANLLRALLDRDRLHAFFRTGYEVDRKLDPLRMLRNATRAARVTGELLDGIAATRRLDTKLPQWITRAARLAAAMVEVAAPASFKGLLFRRWLALAYLVVGLLIGLGALWNAGALRLGLVALVVLGGVHVLTLTMRDLIERKTSVLAGLRRLVTIVVLALAAYGAVKLSEEVRPLFEERLNDRAPADTTPAAANRS